MLTQATAITAVFDTDLQRAFKSPMLCDVTRIHTGSVVTPKVTHCTDDGTWGRVGGSRKIHMAKTPLFKGGEASLDRVLERKEDAYWSIEVCEFTSWSMGFVKFQGEWSTSALAEGGVRITYRYTLFSTSRVFYPLHLAVRETGLAHLHEAGAGERTEVDLGEGALYVCVVLHRMAGQPTGRTLRSAVDCAPRGSQ